MSSDLDQMLRNLYGVTPGDFIAERNSLAKELKAAGDDDLAGKVKALRKPKLAEHALNRVAREDRTVMDRFVAAAAAAQDAQSKAIGGDAARLREATAELRQAMAAVADSAVRLLSAAGASGEGQRDEIMALLRDAVAGGTEQFAAGVLGSADIDLPTELFAGAPEPPARSSASATRAKPAKPAKPASKPSSKAEARDPEPAATSPAKPRLTAKEARDRKATQAKLDRARRDAARAIDDLDLAIADLEAEIATRARRLQGLNDQREELSAKLERADADLAAFGDD